MIFPSKIRERYEIKEELGKGGMGAVFRAYDKTIKSEVALKTLLDITDGEALRMFRAECDKLARMVHPNIVEIRDIGEFDNGNGKQPYLVMPLLRGATLDQLIKRSGTRLPITRAVDILCQACRGLQAAHDAGLIHRDIKPSNIFVLEDDSVKLIDFGVAHWGDHTHTVGRKGTLLYMPPEQIQMKGVSPLSDIFSLGVVAYQTLTGRSPFERRTEEEVAQAVLGYIPPPASEYNAEVSMDLSQAVHKAMAKRPSNRYRTAKEFGETLQRALNQQPIEMFNPARIQPRVEQATQVLEKGDLELAAEIIGELEAEGHLDQRIIALQRRIEQSKRSRKVQNLLDGARTRVREGEFPLALQKIQEALEIDKNNSDALSLKESVESRRAEQSVSDWLQLARQHTDNFAHDRAREALHNVLEIKPNDSRAMAMLSEVDRRKAEYEKVLHEKERMYAAAEAAYGRGEVSSALSKMDRVLQLDKEAPDRTKADRSTAYQSLYNEIRSEHDSLENSYAEARARQASRDYAGALAVCNATLTKHPGHALFQALKLDLEVSQRQQLSGFIAEVERKVDTEPDLDKRISIFKDAIDRFPAVEHFQTNYRLACEKRDLIESIVSKAHFFEEHAQFSEALAQWEILRSIYDRYPGLEFEVQRIRKRRDHQAHSEARARCLQQIESAIDSSEFTRALELLEPAKKEFPGDPDILQAERFAQQGHERVEQAGTLLDAALELRSNGHLTEAVDTLQKAYALDRTNPNLCEALQSAFIEQARGDLDKDWRRAEKLLHQAQELGSGHYAVKGLLRAVADHRRLEEIGEILDRARAMQSAGDVQGAYDFTTEKLKIYAQDIDLQQLNSRLKKLLGQERVLDPVASGSNVAARDIELAKTIVEPFPPNPTNPKLGVGQKGRDRLNTIQEPLPPRNVEPRATERRNAKKQFVLLTTPLKSWFSASPRNRNTAFGIGAALLAGIVFLLAHKPLYKSQGYVATPVLTTTTLEVLSVPLGASLVINNKLKGTADGQRITVDPGPITIVATYPGYQSLTKSLFLREGDQGRENLALALLAPSVRLETALVSGQVLLDGKPAGDLKESQFALDKLSDGPHKVTVKGERSFGFDFTLANNEVVPTSASAGVGGTLVLVANVNARLQVSCNRTGLTLKIDDQDVGTCSVKSAEIPSLSLGRHTLEVFEGKQSLGAKNVELGPATSLNAYLLGDSDQGFLTVTANEEDFTVTFDGHESINPGRRGKWPRYLPPGKHVISVKKDGFTVQPESASLTIEKGKPADFSFQFTPIPVTSTVTFITEHEPGVQIFSEGKLLGTTKTDGRVEIPGIQLGTLKVTLTKKGFADYSGSVLITTDKQIVRLSMQELPAHLTVTVTPKDAQIVVTRDDKGPRQNSTGRFNADLAKGGYTVEISAPNFITQTTRLTLTAGDKKNLEIELDSPTRSEPEKPKPVKSTGLPGFSPPDEDGYRTANRATSYPIASGLPTSVSFTAMKERKMGFKGSIQWYFHGKDGSFINFRLEEKKLKWYAPKESSVPITLVKGEHHIKMTISDAGITVSVDNAKPILIQFDLKKFADCEFGFRLDKLETLSVKDFQYSGT